ncbi:MAG TPA: hypothetical protein VGD35_00770 [Chitinophaga sp.]
MKHLYLLLSITLLFAACSKDKFDPSKPRHGQVVELFVDHYMSGSDSRVFLNANRNEHLSTGVEKFSSRELGFTYVIKAKTVVPKEPPMDGHSYWFEYIETIRKEKYEGQDTIVLPIYGGIGPFPAAFVYKSADEYRYTGGQLAPFDNTVKANLDTAIARARVLLSGPTPAKPGALYVKHNPDNYGKGYVVYRVVIQ